MTSKQLGAVALKCLAIYLFFAAAATFLMWINLIRSIAEFQRSVLSRFSLPVSDLQTAAVIVCIILTAGVGILAWRFANRLAVLAATPHMDNIHVNITPRRLEEILYQVLGVYLIVIHIQPFVKEIIMRLVLMHGNFSTREMRWNFYATFGVLALGLMLTIKPGMLIDLLDRMAGRKKPAVPPNE